MPQEFYSRAQTIKVFAIINLCSVIFFIVSVFMSLELIFTIGFNWVILPFLLLFFISIILMFSIERRTRIFSKDTLPFCVPILLNTTESISTLLGANNIYEDVYAALTHVKGYSVRLLIQNAEQFDRAFLSEQRRKVNRVLNKLYGNKQMVSFYSAFKMVRINLVVCQSSNESLLQYLSKSIEKLLFRNEVIIPIAVVLNDTAVLFPKPPANISINQLSRYVTAVTYIVEKLARDKGTSTEDKGTGLLSPPTKAK